MIKKVLPTHSFIHKGFEVGIFLKGVNGLLEIGFGIFLFFIRPEMARQIVTAVLCRELTEDPNDIVANYLMNMAHNFSMGTKSFAIIYLLSHGVIKIFLVLLLWKRKLWAYPLAMVAFSVFSGYQIYRYTFTHSVELIILTVFDVIIITLTGLEFKRLKNANHAAR